MHQKLNLINTFVVAFLIDSIFVMLQWSFNRSLNVPFALIMPLKVLICGCCLWCYKKGGLHHRLSFMSTTLVLLLMLVGMFRGIFAVDGYWGYKGWMNCVLSALSFVLIFPLGNPTIAAKILQYWNRYIIPVFVLFGLWAMNKDAYPFQIPFIYYFYILFFPIVISNPKARWLIIIGTVCTLVALENRSAIIKTLLAITLCATLYLPHFLQKVSHIFIHFLLYLIPIVLLVLGLTGTFNIFQDLSDEEQTEITRSNDVDEEEQNEPAQDLTADTRTFLYIEVIASAIEGDYVLFGNSIGRGNKSTLIWTDIEDLESERLMNEAHMLNIFTWTGILGIILYTIMYLQSSCLGLFYSKNRFVPLIACAVAFHWAMMWLEECPSFNPMDYALFLLLGVCFSPRFRRMSDMEFRLWFRSCFAAPQDFTSYDAWNKLKLKLLLLTDKRNEKD